MDSTIMAIVLSQIYVQAVEYILNDQTINSEQVCGRVSGGSSTAIYSRTRYLPDNTTYHASLYVAIRPTPVLAGAAIKSS